MGSENRSLGEVIIGFGYKASETIAGGLNKALPCLEDLHKSSSSLYEHGSTRKTHLDGSLCAGGNCQVCKGADITLTN